MTYNKSDQFTIRVHYVNIEGQGMRRRPALMALLLAVQVGAANLCLASTSTAAAAVQATTYVVFDADPKPRPSLATATIEFRDQVASQAGRGAELLIVVHGLDAKGDTVIAIRERVPLRAGSYSHDDQGVTVRSTWRGAPLNLTFRAAPEPPTPMNAIVSIGFGYYTALIGQIAERSVGGTVDMLGYRGCRADATSQYRRSASGTGTTPSAVDLTTTAQWKKPKNCAR